MPPAPVTVRPRTAADLLVLVGILEAQRPTSGYPVRWPLPFPAEEFIARRTELAAWVAVDPARAGAVVGHVSLTDVAPGWEADGWGAGTGLPASALAAVAARRPRAAAAHGAAGARSGPGRRVTQHPSQPHR